VDITQHRFVCSKLLRQYVATDDFVSVSLHFFCPGKTTVAGIYGRILKDLGLLSKGDFLVKVPADFIGSVLGESEKKTMAVLEEARGCVLVIDEAYGLHSGTKLRDPFKVLATSLLMPVLQLQLFSGCAVCESRCNACLATTAACCCCCCCCFDLSLAAVANHLRFSYCFPVVPAGGCD
jgi:hypothetical protein